MRCFALTLLLCSAAWGQTTQVESPVEPPREHDALSAREQSVLARDRSLDATAWLVPAFEAGFAMAHPARNQPADWSIGASGFAHLYAGYLARQSAATATQFATALVLGEDPRYWPSRDHNPARRAAHAALSTVFDQRSRGWQRHTVALSNLAAAFTAASLANAWQPAQFRNSTHLGQRTLTSLAGIAGGNLAAEFRPEAKLEMKRLVRRYRLFVRFGRRSPQLK